MGDKRVWMAQVHTSIPCAFSIEGSLSQRRTNPPRRERVWVDPFKVGKTAGMQKLSLLKDKVLHTEQSSLEITSTASRTGSLREVVNSAQEMKDFDQVIPAVLFESHHMLGNPSTSVQTETL